MPDDSGAMADGSVFHHARRRAGAGAAVLGAVGRAAPHVVRLRPEGGADAPARIDVPVRDRAADDARAPRIRDPRGLVRGTRPRRVWRPRARRTAVRAEHREHRRGVADQPDGDVPRGHDAGRAARRSEPRGRFAGGGRVPAHSRRPGPGRVDERAARMVRALGRGQDLDAERHGEHGLDLARAAPPDRLHPGRRRSEHRRDRHQRRRPALLERRGDDADAHARHADHDAGGRDGAHRQDGARLLRLGVGRGQHRDRRLRAHHGAERPGAVLGAGPARRVPDPHAALRALLPDARRALPAACRDGRPARARYSRLPARQPRRRLRHRGRRVLRRDEPRPEAPVRHPPCHAVGV